MKRWALAITFLTASFAHAETALDGCATIDADLDRLACYDKASGRTPETTTATPINISGDWSTRLDKSKFEDTTDVYLSVRSNDTVDCGGFSAPERITLYLRCQENTTSLIIATSNCHVASGFGGYGQVDMRTDGDKARTVSMVESTHNRSLGLWSGGKAIPAIKRLFGKETLLVRFTPFNESPVTAEFNITGVENAVETLREACNW